MTTDLRKTGVDVVGDMPWGTHFCLFYETKADLLEVTISYCKAGLRSQEFCLWVVFWMEAQTVPPCNRMESNGRR
jgi:hypothetical protein